jgi:hypothetical protein
MTSFAKFLKQRGALGEVEVTVELRVRGDDL